MSLKDPSDTEHQPLPFATATIARLCVLQGKLEQAELIYRQLLDESPRDGRLQQGLDEVRRRMQARMQPVPGDDRVELRRESGRLRCRYSITAEGRHRAELLLAGSGTLVLRLTAFPAEPGLPPRDEPLAEAAGEIELEPPPKAAVLAAAVGLSGDDGRFAAIAHCCTAPT